MAQDKQRILDILHTTTELIYDAQELVGDLVPKSMDDRVQLVLISEKLALADAALNSISNGEKPLNVGALNE